MEELAGGCWVNQAVDMAPHPEQGPVPLGQWLLPFTSPRVQHCSAHCPFPPLLAAVFCKPYLRRVQSLAFHVGEKFS